MAVPVVWCDVRCVLCSVSPLSQAQLAPARTLYLDFVKAQTGVSPRVELQLSNDFLPPAPRPNEAGLSCCGGVVLSARNGTIVCKNTLDRCSALRSAYSNAPPLALPPSRLLSDRLSSPLPFAFCSEPDRHASPMLPIRLR
jgi:hypothetical protein